MQDLIVFPFGELPDEKWKEAVAAEEQHLRDRVASYKGGPPVDAEVAAINIGRGADWIVLAVSFGVAAIAIPEAHKKIRENIEEWIRIHRELYAFFGWIMEGRKALYPNEYLFLKAIETLSDELRLEPLEFKSVGRIPEVNPDLKGREALIFSFGDSNKLVQVAVARDGSLLWQNSVTLRYSPNKDKGAEDGEQAAAPLCTATIGPGKPILTTKINLIDLEHVRSCRGPFLEFLRNLTPQTILLSFSILMTARIDFTQFDLHLNNLLVTSIFYLLLFSFIFSVYANSTIFIEKCFPNLSDWQTNQIKLLKSEGVRWYRRFDRMMLAVARERLFAVVGYVVMVIFIEAAFIIVVVMSLNSANKMWKDNPPSASSTVTKAQKKP